VHVKPGTSEHINVGLTIHLNETQRVGSVEVQTPTPGFSLEVYGTSSSNPPASIHTWTLLGVASNVSSGQTIKLGQSAEHWRQVVLWVPSAPERLRSITISEVTLFEP
jgi:hypothetical protein